MGDEHAILNHYNLTTPYPTTWPVEKDDSDASDDAFPVKPSIRRSKSRYSALERSGSDRRSLVPGSEKTGDGVENLVQKDEADPLGNADSVVRVLRQKGIAVEDDQRLRNRFLLSSTTFSPTLYLSQIHSNASTQSLLQGLDFLSRSIDQKSASLKVLVESNFERFVRAKTTIDNVYAEMRNQGAESVSEKSRTSQRVVSKGSAHFRNASGQTPSTPSRANKPLPSDKKKNALTKESEYGVQGIKAPLIEVAVKAEEIWGPALGGREKEGALKMALDSIDKNRGIFEINATISDSIKRKDYERLIEEYTQARKYAEEAREIVNTGMEHKVSLTEAQIHQIVITARMWSDVEDRINEFKRNVWRKLTNVQAVAVATQRGSQYEEYLVLIGILLELGVEDNPIWLWLLSRYDYLKNKIHASFERSRVEIEVLRRHLANAERPTPQTIALHLKTSTRQNLSDKVKDIDTPPVLEFWDLIFNSFSNLLSAQGGVFGEVVEFWDKAQTFIDGKAQKILPVGIDGRSRIHHRLSTDGIRHLQNGVVELIEILREHIFAFFADPPIEDISMLYSPVPPLTPSTPKSATRSPFAHQDSRFKFDANNPPPPSPKRGEVWEEFAFWPPYGNSLSGAYYLGRLLTLLGAAAGEMLRLRQVVSGAHLSERLRSLIAGARERSTRAVCAAWNRDAEACKVLEDWTRSAERRDLTTMPAYFSAFEAAVLSGMQKILYISEATSNRPGSSGVVSPPPAKLLQMVRNQFVMTLYNALSGMVENAERPVSQGNSIWVTGSDFTDELAAGSLKMNEDGGVINVKSRNTRMLLTLSNLKALQSDIVPQLISQFEMNFSVKLTDESKTVRDDLEKIEAKLFQSYTRPTNDQLSSMIRSGISSPAWVPKTSRPQQVRPYVYKALLLLVYVHTEVSTTAAGLTTQILSHLFEQMSLSFLEALKARGKYSLPALMQATLDLEFVAHTMSQYTTDRASKTQDEIYSELDRRTDDNARIKSRDELVEIGLVLKKLREGTRSEFACFKKQRGQPKER